MNGVVGNDFVVIGSGVSSRILTEFRTFGSGFFVVIIFDQKYLYNVTCYYYLPKKSPNTSTDVPLQES